MRNVSLFAVCVLMSSLTAQTQYHWVYPDFHNGAVTAMEVSRNNRWLLTGGADGRAMLFDLEKRMLLRQFNGHFDALTNASFALNDSRVITTSFDGKIIVWDTKTGLQKRSWSALSGIVPNPQKAWNRNPLFPPFCLDSSAKHMIFYAFQPEKTGWNLGDKPKVSIAFYDFKKDTLLWTMPVQGFDVEGRPFSLSHNAEWLLFTDYVRNAGTGINEPYIRLVYTADTALQYRWWGNEAVFDGNEVLICNGHNLLRFNPSYETSAVRNISGGYGYYKQFTGSDYLIMQCMQQKEAGNIAARNFNVKSPFQNTADSILYYLTGSREMKLPYWRVADLQNQQTYTIRIQQDSSPAWQPVYRINQALSTHGIMAFSKGNEKFAFIELNTGNTVVMNFFPGKSYPKAITSLQNSAGRWLISVEHEPANLHEFSLYELKLDFSSGKYVLSGFLSSPILNKSLSVEDDNQILPDLIIFPDGNRVLASDKSGGVRISDYSNGIVREKAAILPDNKVSLGPAAVNATGSLIRCFSSFNNIYTYSAKTGQPQSAKKTDKWRLLPDQSLFNKNTICFDADSVWKVEFTRGKALVINTKSNAQTIIFTGETAMADFQVVNNRFLFGMGSDGGLRAYSLETTQLLFTQFIFNNGGQLIFAPDGRMDANEQAKKIIYAVDGFNIMTIAESNKYNGTGYNITPGLRKQLLR